MNDLAQGSRPDPPESLPARIAAGDASAEAELARHFGPRVLLILSARLRDRETAREATNDVLMAVIAALRAGRLRDPLALAGFVHGTLQNVAKNRVRAFARRPRHEPLEAAEPHARVEDDGERRERVAQVGRLLLELDERDRRILELTLGEGLKPGEIAARLGLSAELVRLRKSRAVRRLAERMRDTTRSGPAGDYEVGDP